MSVDYSCDVIYGILVEGSDKVADILYEIEDDDAIYGFEVLLRKNSGCGLYHVGNFMSGSTEHILGFKKNTHSWDRYGEEGPVVSPLVVDKEADSALQKACKMCNEVGITVQGTPMWYFCRTVS